MAETVGDHVLARLREWGVEQVFGYPGDGINGLIVAFGNADDRPRFIQARHEEMSAMAAVGYAKFSGRPGVCMATSGPGAIHLLNGLYDAKLDHVPVVAIVGQTERSAMGGAYQQEVDLQALLKDVASEYLVEVNVAQQLPNAIDRAFRTALARRAPTAVIIPSDLQSEPYEAPEHAFKQVPSSPPNAFAATLSPDPAAVRRRRSNRSPTSSARVWRRRCSARTCCPTTCRSSRGRSACWAPGPATSSCATATRS